MTMERRTVRLLVVDENGGTDDSTRQLVMRSK